MGFIRRKRGMFTEAEDKRIISLIGKSPDIRYILGQNLDLFPGRTLSSLYTRARLLQERGMIPRTPVRPYTKELPFEEDEEGEEITSARVRRVHEPRSLGPPIARPTWFEDRDEILKKLTSRR